MFIILGIYLNILNYIENSEWYINLMQKKDYVYVIDIMKCFF